MKKLLFFLLIALLFIGSLIVLIYSIEQINRNIESLNFLETLYHQAISDMQIKEYETYEKNLKWSISANALFALSSFLYSTLVIIGSKAIIKYADIDYSIRYTYEEYKSLREAKKAEKQRKKKEKLQKQLDKIEKAE